MRVKAGLARRDESAGQRVPVHGLEADQGRGVERAAAGAGLSRGTVSKADWVSSGWSWRSLTAGRTPFHAS